MNILSLEIEKLGTMTHTHANITRAIDQSFGWLQTEEVITSRKKLRTHLMTLETMIDEQNKLISELRGRLGNEHTECA